MTGASVVKLSIRLTSLLSILSRVAISFNGKLVAAQTEERADLLHGRAAGL